MIVISGALVLMAAVLLFIGLLASGSLTAIYVSIGLSIVAAVFLWIGINQRPVEVTAEAGVGGGDRRDRGGRQREDQRDAESSQQGRSDGKQASSDPPKAAERPADVTEQIDVMSDDLIEDSDERTVAAAVATGADVFVVSGFPRYHLDECPAVTGNDEAESLPIGEARELGFVPCGACRPDSEIAENAALPHTSNGSANGSAAPAPAPTEDSTSSAEPELVNAPPAVAAQAQQPSPMPPPAVAPPPGTDVQPPAPTAPTAPQQPGPEVPAVAPPLPASAQPVAYQQQPAAQWAQPAPPQPAQWEQPAAPVAQQPVQQPVQQPAPPVAQPPAAPVVQPPAAQPTATEQVVVLPGKARFHRQGCRLVSGSEPTETLDKTDAVRQGYLACAICKP